MHELDYSVCMHVCMCLIILIILFRQYFSNSSINKANSQLFPLPNRRNVNIFPEESFSFLFKNFISIFMSLKTLYSLYLLSLLLIIQQEHHFISYTKSFMNFIIVIWWIYYSWIKYRYIFLFFLRYIYKYFEKYRVKFFERYINIIQIVSIQQGI